ncbi:hypothetical protein P692DRAFT_20827900 [Suillus brevipes Sb2]|nr:hypothetical protein P692DRAFT_20827900 [Suillus brevipes Sb2]
MNKLRKPKSSAMICHSPCQVLKQLDLASTNVCCLSKATSGVENDADCECFTCCGKNLY